MAPNSILLWYVLLFCLLLYAGLLPAFNTPTGIPLSDVNLKTGYAHGPQWSHQESSISEASTLLLEFSTVSKLTNRSVFTQVAERAFEVWK